jgi:hypothetical protein
MTHKEVRMSRRIAAAVGASALLLAAAPPALAANTVFGGSTDAGEPIVLNGDQPAKQLRSAVIAVEAKCSEGTFPFVLAVAPKKASPGFTPGPHDLIMVRNGKGRFAGVAGGGVDLGDSFALATASLSGKLKAKGASGVLKLDISIVDKQTNNERESCHSGALRWAASHSPGRVYGGRSSQGEPVVVRLDAKRRKVTDVLAGWESASCTPEGFMRFGERFTNFPLHAGHFGGTWDQPFATDDGGKIDYAYALAGKVAKRTTSGTLHVGVTGTDATGATTLTCDTGSVTWKAVTG